MSRKLLPLVALLLIQFFLRSHGIRAQEPYFDEGYHIARASEAWKFTTNPGKFADGKLLIYYWLGLFKAAPTNSLVTGRLSIALFSLITGAAIYASMHWLDGHGAGLLALAVYAVLPLALIFERMALADPLASGLASLVVWRSLIAARRPTIGQGIVVGVLMALATMAKLTMVALPLVTVGAALIFRRSEGARWLRTYAPLLAAVAVTVITLWLPVLIAAYLGADNTEGLLIANPITFHRDLPSAAAGPLDYVRKIVPLLTELVAPAFMAAVGVALALALVSGAEYRRIAAFILLTGIAFALPTILIARWITSRYLMPLAVPGVMLLVLGFRPLWHKLPVARAGLVGAAAIWFVGFALPFAQTALSDPQRLDLSGQNWMELQSGMGLADDRMREAVAWLEKADPGPVYATYESCHLMQLLTDQLKLRCLEPDPIPHTGSLWQAELAPGETAYFVHSGFYGPFHLGIDWLDTQEIQLQTPPQYADPYFEFRLWKIWKRAE